MLFYITETCQISLHSTDTSTCGYVSTEARGQHQGSSSVTLDQPYLSRQVLSLNLELSNQVRLATQVSLEILLSTP